MNQLLQVSITDSRETLDGTGFINKFVPVLTDIGAILEGRDWFHAQITASATRQHEVRNRTFRLRACQVDAFSSNNVIGNKIISDVSSGSANIASLQTVFFSLRHNKGTVPAPPTPTTPLPTHPPC